MGLVSCLLKNRDQSLIIPPYQRSIYEETKYDCFGAKEDSYARGLMFKEIPDMATLMEMVLIIVGIAIIHLFSKMGQH